MAYRDYVRDFLTDSWTQTTATATTSNSLWVAVGGGTGALGGSGLLGGLGRGLGQQIAFAPRPPPAPKTFREELQAEIDAWLPKLAA